MMSNEIQFTTSSGTVALTTKQVAERFNVTVGNVLLMNRLHGTYKGYKPTRLSNRLYWIPTVDNSQPMEDSNVVI